MKTRTFSIKKPSQIAVVGVGGGGCNAINRMILDGVRNVDFIAVDTASFALDQSVVPHKIQLGRPGLGTGGSIEQGRLAAADSFHAIQEAIQHAKMVFVMAGLSGGTGTGAAPIVAQIAREAGALTVGIVTYPFSFEGTVRMDTAKAGMEAIKANCNSMIAIPNDRLLDIEEDAKVSINESFAHVDDVLKQAVQCIAELIDVHGLINVDFNDVKTVLSTGGASIMATGSASGPNKARLAAEHAVIANPLNITVKGAKGIIFNVTAGPDVGVHEVEEAANIVREHAHPDVNLFYGTVIDESMHDEIRITLIASGFEFVDPTPKTDEQRIEEIVEVAVPTEQVKTRRIYVSRPANRPKSLPGTERWSAGSNHLRNGRFNPGNHDLPAFLRN